ncbi:unnamed protein product, partial [Didymodactylos carnosus]
LKSFGLNEHQIICIVPDCEELTNEQKKNLMNNEINNVLSISKIEDNNAAFDSNLEVLKENIFNMIGIGKNSRIPIVGSLRREDYNVYVEIENNIHNKQFNNIHIDIQDDNLKKLSIEINKQLQKINRNMNNLQSFLFKQ